MWNTDTRSCILCRRSYHQWWSMGATLIGDDPELAWYYLVLIYRPSKDGRLSWLSSVKYRKICWYCLHGKSNGLGNYFVCKRFAGQTLLWSLEIVIQINLEHDTIAVWNLARSWSISTWILLLELAHHVLVN